MATLSTKTQRNVSLENVTFAPNSLVLLKHTITTSSNGSINTNIKYIEFDNLVKNDDSDIAILSSLISWQLSELNWNTKFATDHGDSGIINRKIFTPFLSVDTIYRTNDKGEIVKAIISPLPLNQTAVKVVPSHKIVGCKPEFYKKLVERHCKAILKQFTKLVDIERGALNLAALLNVPTSKPKVAPKTDNKVA